MIDFKVSKGIPSPLGSSISKEGVQFACADNADGIVIINKKTNDKIKIPFTDEYRFGNIASIIIKNFDFAKYKYCFYKKDEEFADLYSSRIIGNEKYGVKGADYKLTSEVTDHDAFNWENDSYPLTAFEKSVLYLLHVRGFSEHASSKVSNKGTLNGIVQKIPYLKNLGITALELMPAYEFEEYTKPDKRVTDMAEVSGAKVVNKLNYWGYKEAYYFAPKASYTHSGDAVKDFKDFVKAMHKEGLEVIMQFYFPDEIKAYFIYEVIKYWKLNYHIDGFHLKGNNIPLSLIACDPLFSDTKLFYDYIPEEEIYDFNEIPKKKNLCVYSDAFMYQMRKALKGDEDTLKDVIFNTRNMPSKSSITNFITNYYGFTLYDLVSYDRKHNDDNGEKNSDGCDYNYSWNCGIEGKTKKASVLNLRKRMMKNALFLVFSSKGVPLIYAGDELANTQQGNNNPYCQDNSISYINWNQNALADEIHDYVKELIALRKNSFNDILNREFSLLDRNRIGYPDLSYHSDEAWKADLATYNRHLGIMYSDYDNKSEEITLYYFAYNFYWKEITFSLPYIPSKTKWDIVLSTGNVKNIENKEAKNQGMEFELEHRSCALFRVSFKKTDKKIQP